MAPEGWRKDQIGNHIDLLSGYPFRSEKYLNSTDNGIRLLRGDNIGQGFLRWRNAKLWPNNEVDGLDRYYLSAGDFVIAMDRTWISSGLKISEVSERDLPSLLVQRVSRLRAKKSLEQGLLRQIFSSHRFEQYVKSVQTETAVPHISAQQIKDFTFLLPPADEGRKIAQILSTWDKVIDTVERLIENAKAQKKALMQKLLLGSERLPGYEEQWNLRLLEEVAVIAVSPVDKKSSAGEKTVRLCNYTDVYYNDHIFDDMDFMVATASDNEIERFSLRQGDVVITKDSETPDDIAIPAYVEQELNGVVCGYHLAIIRPDTDLADGQFLAYLFSLPHTRYYFFTLANGATRFGLGVESICRASFSLPQIEEQKAIAKIIRTADAELFSLRKQLGALREEKKALMQQLLTGKRRVTVTDQDREPASA